VQVDPEGVHGTRQLPLKAPSVLTQIKPSQQSLFEAHVVSAFPHDPWQTPVTHG